MDPVKKFLEEQAFLTSSVGEDAMGGMPGLGTCKRNRAMMSCISCKPGCHVSMWCLATLVTDTL